MAGLELDVVHFPLVFIRFAPQNASDDEVRWLITEQRKLFDRKERMVMLVDASTLTSTTSVQRKMYADWMKESEPLSKRYSAGVSIVISNAVVRGALQAVKWFITPPMPVEAFGTMREAATKAADWMRAESMRNVDAAERMATRAA